MGTNLGLLYIVEGNSRQSGSENGVDSTAHNDG